MKKNFILPLCFLASLTTFVEAQELAHTHTKIPPRLTNSYDSHFLEDLIAENPFLQHRRNYCRDYFWPPMGNDIAASHTPYLAVNFGATNPATIYLQSERNALLRKMYQQSSRPTNGESKDLLFKVAGTFVEALLENSQRKP